MEESDFSPTREKDLHAFMPDLFRGWAGSRFGEWRRDEAGWSQDIKRLSMKAELVPENGDPPIPITRDLVIIGRRGYCDIVIDHPSLSKRHCVIVKTDGLLVIRDLISTNGTKVKGQKIRWAALLPDDRISLGNYKLRVYLGPDDAPGPSELFRARASRGALRPGRLPPARGAST